MTTKNGRKPPKIVRSLADLTPDKANARRHSPRSVGLIETALGEVGAARSIVIDETGRILAGNATVEAAARAGIERVKVVEATGNELVAVRRTGLTKRQKTRLALLDNAPNSPEANPIYWEAEQLAALVEADRTLLADILYDDEIMELVKSESFIGSERLREETIAIRPKKMFHVLICVPAEKAIDIQDAIESIAAIPGAEVEYGGN